MYLFKGLSGNIIEFILFNWNHMYKLNIRVYTVADWEGPEGAFAPPPPPKIGTKKEKSFLILLFFDIWC